MEAFIKNLMKYQKSIASKEEVAKDKLKSTLASHETHRNFNSDLSITLGTIESLFQNSCSFSDEQIIFLMDSVNIIIGNHLDLLMKMKLKTKRDVKGKKCVCQENLGVIWASNLKRMDKIFSYVKHTLTLYLSSPLEEIKLEGTRLLFKFLKMILKDLSV